MYKRTGIFAEDHAASELRELEEELHAVNRCIAEYENNKSLPAKKVSLLSSSLSVPTLSASRSSISSSNSHARLPVIESIKSTTQVLPIPKVHLTLTMALKAPVVQPLDLQSPLQVHAVPGHNIQALTQPTDSKASTLPKINT